MFQWGRDERRDGGGDEGEMGKKDMDMDDRLEGKEWLQRLSINKKVLFLEFR